MGSIVHLAFKSPHVVSDSMAFIACGHCRNKTYTLTEDHLDNFPLMRCAACGQHIGRMGWSHDDDPERGGTEPRKEIKPLPSPPGRRKC